MPNHLRFDYYALFSLVYFLEGILGVTGIAMPLFMKEELGLSIAEIAAYSGVMALPWIFKPVYGLFSDYVPLFGYRRKSYLLISASFAVVGWIFTSTFVETLAFLLAAQFLVNIGIASMDVFTDGLAVQKSTKETRGFIQSLCWGSRSLGAVVAGFFSGYLLNFFSYRGIFLLASFIPFLVFCLAGIIKEPSYKRQMLPSIKIFMRKEIWIVVAFLFAFFATPSFGTPLFFHLKEQLGFSELFLGTLSSLSSIGGLLGAIAYATLFDKYALKPLLFWLVLTNLIFSLSYLFLFGTTSALAIYLTNGFIGYVSLIACMKLIATICPAGSEATLFAIITGMVNISGSVFSPMLGGWLISFVSLPLLILIAAFSNLIPLILCTMIDEKE